MYTTELNMQFAICVVGDEEGDLDAWKVYRILPDPKATEMGCLRVIDESGEDYLYPQTYFVSLELPPEAKNKLLATVTP